jgi:MFS family permease
MPQFTQTIREKISDKRNILIASYAAAVFLYWMSLYLYAPTLPVYVETKTDNLAMVGIVLAMYGFWQAVIRLPVGIAADWLGARKPFLIGGFILAGLGAWLLGNANSVPGLITGRSITGLAAATWVPLVVSFSILFKPEEAVHATAILTLVSSFSRMIATGVTGTLNTLGGYPLAYFLAAGAALLALLVILPVREEKRIPQNRNSKQILELISRRDVLLPALLATITQYVIWTSTFGFIPILAKQLGANDVTQSLLMSMNIAVVLLGNLATTTLVRRIGSRKLVLIGIIFLCSGIFIAALAQSLLAIFIAQFCSGMATGISSPILMGKSIAFLSQLSF